MKCPHCNKQMIIEERCLRNAETYHNPVLAKTECCGKGVIIQPIISFNITPYNGEKKEDDWGVKFKK